MEHSETNGDAMVGDVPEVDNETTSPQKQMTSMDDSNMVCDTKVVENISVSDDIASGSPNNACMVDSPTNCSPQMKDSEADVSSIDLVAVESAPEKSTSEDEAIAKKCQAEIVSQNSTPVKTVVDALVTNTMEVDASPEKAETSTPPAIDHPADNEDCVSVQTNQLSVTPFVVTVDDGCNSPEKSSKTINPDEEYFNSLPEEDTEYFKKNLITAKKMQKKILHCTSCSKTVYLTFDADALVRHPLLGVPICRSCNLYYNDGEWTKEEDGSDMFCRWCANGGELIMCDESNHAFCVECLGRNFGKKSLSAIKKFDWVCMVCKPDQIKDLRSTYYSISNYRSLARDGTVASTPKTDFVSRTITGIRNELTNALDKMDIKILVWKETEDMDKDDFGLITSTVSGLRSIFFYHRKSMQTFEQSLIKDYSAAFPAKNITDVLHVLGIPDVVMPTVKKKTHVVKKPKKYKAVTFSKKKTITPKIRAVVSKPLGSKTNVKVSSKLFKVGEKRSAVLEGANESKRRKSRR